MSEYPTVMLIHATPEFVSTAAHVEPQETGRSLWQTITSFQLEVASTLVRVHMYIHEYT